MKSAAARAVQVRWAGIQSFKFTEGRWRPTGTTERGMTCRGGMQIPACDRSDTTCFVRFRERNGPLLLSLVETRRVGSRVKSRYPAAHADDEEATDVRRDAMNAKDVTFNVRRLRREGKTKIGRADALPHGIIEELLALAHGFKSRHNRRPRAKILAASDHTMIEAYASGSAMRAGEPSKADQAHVCAELLTELDVRPRPNQR